MSTPAFSDEPFYFFGLSCELRNEIYSYLQKDLQLVLARPVFDQNGAIDPASIEHERDCLRCLSPSIEPTYLLISKQFKDEYEEKLWLDAVLTIDCRTLDIPGNLPPRVFTALLPEVAKKVRAVRITFSMTGLRDTVSFWGPNPPATVALMAGLSGLPALQRLTISFGENWSETNLGGPMARWFWWWGASRSNTLSQMDVFNAAVKAKAANLGIEDFKSEIVIHDRLFEMMDKSFQVLDNVDEWKPYEEMNRLLKSLDNCLVFRLTPTSRDLGFEGWEMKIIARGMFDKEKHDSIHAGTWRTQPWAGKGPADVGLPNKTLHTWL